MGSLDYSHPESVSCFSSLPEVETDEVFRLLRTYHTDSHPNRVNLAAGIYCCDEGQSWPLEVVARAEKSLHSQTNIRRHDYLPIEGDPRFLNVARDLIFSPPTIPADSRTDLPRSALNSRIVSIQTLSGTGANHVGARFLAETIQPRCVWFSDPTWDNHHLIWNSVGVPQRMYPYYNPATRSYDFAGMMETLEREAQPRDVVVLHACAHNPTGIDPSPEQWMAIAKICQRKGLFPFFDNAYQGFASGDPARDSWAIRYFSQLEPSLEMCVAQSFSKNFGLYGQRTGSFHLVMNETFTGSRSKVIGALSNLIRSEYSVSPRYGSDIVRTILESETLVKEWLVDIRVISDRINSMRVALSNELCSLSTPGPWQQIIKQVGMFSLTDLTPSEIEMLRIQFHIYIISSGRISMAGLNTRNVKYVASAIHSVRTQSCSHPNWKRSV